MAPSPPSSPIKKKKKKSKSKHHSPVTLAVSVVSPDAAASSSLPAVGYFPSGYDPTTGGAAPDVRAFRNVSHPSRMDLVVSGPRGMEFVGKSYAGEALAWPRLCGYAVGVYDKTAGTLKIVPIAADKIFRLEPQIEVEELLQAEPSEALTDELRSPVKSAKKIQDLTKQYGSKKDKERDKKWRTINEQRNDPFAYEPMEPEEAEAEASMSAAAAVQDPTPRNIPPHDLSADTAEAAYLINEIIPKREWASLLDILEHLESGEPLSSKGYPNFVCTRVLKLQETKDKEEKENLARTLSYITHLITFREMCLEKNNSRSQKYSKSKDRPRVPHIVLDRLRQLFLDSETSRLSSEKNELLIGYILVLTLFADEFRSDTTDMCNDLKLTYEILKPYYQHLGCKIMVEGALKSRIASLPVPLKFPDLRKRRRR